MLGVSDESILGTRVKCLSRPRLRAACSQSQFDLGQVLSLRSSGLGLIFSDWLSSRA